MILTHEIIRIAYEQYKQGNTLSETTEIINKKYNLNICPSAISLRFRKEGLRLRGYKESSTISKRKHINIPKLLEEYSNTNSIREISRTSGVSRKTIQKILNENKIIIPSSRTALIRIGYIKEKDKFILNPQEKAYLYGLVMGDLTIVKKSDYTLKLITHSTHKTFVDLLLKLFENYGVTNYRETKREGMFRFQTHIDLESFSFLLGCKGETIPEWINNDNFFEFLAGFIDSDGSIIIRKAGDYFQYVIRFFGENINLLIQIKKRLEKLDYNLSMHKNHSKGDISYHKGVKFQYNNDYYALETYKKSQTLDLINKIPIKHPEKIAKIKLIKSIEKKGFRQWYEIETEVKSLKTRIKQSVTQKISLEY